MNLAESIESRLPEGFVIREQLGEGATSWVFLAVGADATEGIVVKVLRLGAGRERGAERFVQEIKLLRRLDHPRIVPILDAGEVNGALFFTMPFVGRETLRMRLHGRGALPVAEALGIARHLTEALGYAHGQGVVHRDVKPENVLVTPDGARLMDFGFADVPSQSVERPHGNGPRTGVGTPDYVSPEQVLGTRAGDWRSDYFSLGCVLFEMLTGRMPYPADSARATMRRRVEAPAPDVRAVNPAIPSRVAEVVRKTLERSPNDRYATSMHLRMALEQAAADVREIGEATAHGRVG